MVSTYQIHAKLMFHFYHHSQNGTTNYSAVLNFARFASPKSGVGSLATCMLE